MMMKADVLSGIKTIKACTHYLLKDKTIDYLPFEDNSTTVLAKSLVPLPPSAQ